MYLVGAYPASDVSNFIVTHLVIAILEIFKWKHSLWSLWSKKMYLKVILLGVSLFSQSVLPISGITPSQVSHSDTDAFLNSWLTLLSKLFSYCRQAFLSLICSLERVEQINFYLLVWEILFLFLSAVWILSCLPEMI